MANKKSHSGANVPALRFPEFSGEWTQCTLGDITYNFSHRNKEHTQHPMFSVTNNRGFVPQSEQFEDREMVGEDIQAYKVIEKGDFAYNPARINVGSIAKYEGEEKCMISSLYVCFRVADNIDREWFMQLLKTPKMNFHYNLNGEGGVRVYLFYPNFARIRSSFPSIAEQKKIASMLSLIDERIITQSRIIEELTTLRSALHHRIIRQGLVDGSWQQKCLADVLTERTELNDGGYEVRSVSVSKGIVNQIDYLGRSFAAKDTSRYHVAYPGDIVYTKSPTGDYPYGIIKQSQITIKAAISPLYGVYKPISPEVGYVIHNHFLSAKNALNYLHPLIQKGAKNTINITNQRFLQNNMPLPSDRQSACLYYKAIKKLSDKILLEDASLKQLQLQKNYLLKVMFI